jgi:hypothetical protein
MPGSVAATSATVLRPLSLAIGNLKNLYVAGQQFVLPATYT